MCDVILMLGTLSERLTRDEEKLLLTCKVILQLHMRYERELFVSYMSLETDVDIPLSYFSKTSNLSLGYLLICQV